MKDSARQLMRRARVADDGFGLMEAVTASFLLVILGASVLGVLTWQLRTSQSDRDRVSASSLAAREVEIMRQQFATGDTGAAAIIQNTSPVDNAHPLDGGTVGQDISMNGAKFHVESLVTWLPFGAGKSACDGGSLVSYPSVRLTVTVTWNNMSGTAPVTSETVLTPSKSLVDSASAGYLAVGVSNAASEPAAHISVTAAGPGGTSTQVTDDSGCAVFRLTSAGDYTVSMSTAGYVDDSGNPNPSTTTTVSIGNLQRVSMSYDAAATMNVGFSTQSGFAVPSNLPSITIFNSGLQTNVLHTKSFDATGSTTSIANLWPYSDGYTVWAGSCVDSDPAGSPTNGTRAAPVVVAPGGTQTVQVALAPVRITTLHADGTPAGGLAVSAVKPTDGTPAWNTGCAASDSPLNLGVTASSGPDEGVVQASVPYGQWVFQTPDGSATGDIKVDQSGVIDVQVQVP